MAILFLGFGLGYGASALGVRIPTMAPNRVTHGRIDHVVIIVKENHSYDNYFRSLEATGPYLPECPSTTTATNCQYTKVDLPGYYQYVRDYGSADRYFTDTPGPSWPNQMMMVAGQSPLTSDPAASWTCPVTCFDFPTIADSLNSSKVSWRNYGEDIFDPFRAIDHLTSDENHNVGVSRLFQDLGTGSLPSVAWARPSWADSEHPGYDVRRGEQWTVALVDSIMRSKYWNSTAILITWDDAGPVRDHVSPPPVKGQASGSSLRYGPRVPFVVISPYTPAGFISDQTLSHVSILKFIETLFHLTALTSRDAMADDLHEFFDLSQRPRPPVLARD